MRIEQLWRFPVKSLGGERLAQAEFAPGGIPFDRRYIVLDSNPHRAGKPLTGRIQRLMLGFSAYVGAGGVRVRTPAGDEFGAEDERWIRQLEASIGAPASIRRLDEAMHDAADVLVINAASVRKLSAEYGAPIDPLRFRPNIIVDGPSLEPFEETEWNDAVFRAGTAELTAVHPCERCVMTTIDPKTLESDPAFLRFVVEKHQALFGMYFRVVRPGVARDGDRWLREERSEATA